MENEEIKDSNNTVRIKEVFFTTLRKWPWIIVSVVICMSLAAVYLYQKKPVYSRTAKVVFNDLSSGNSINAAMNPFAEMGLVNTSVNQYDEMSKMQSLDVVREAIHRLGLQMDYFMPKAIGNKVLYGSARPVEVAMTSVPEDIGASLKLHISDDGKVTLSDLRLDKDKFEAPKGTYKLGEQIPTAMGPITVNPTSFFKKGEEYTIKVIHRPIISAIETFSGKITMHLEDKFSNTLVIDAYDTSHERATDLINTIIEVYNERWMNSRNEVSVATNKFIEERLRSLEQELGGVDKDIAVYQSKNLLPDVSRSTYMSMEDNQNADKMILDLNNKLQVTRYMKEYLNDASHGGEVLPTNSGIGNLAIEAQIKDYNTKLMERNRFAANSSDNHPMIRDLDSELMSMKMAIISAMENEAASLAYQIKNVRLEKGRAEGQIANAPVQVNYLQGVERQQKVKENLYLYLLQKREENELGKAYTAYNTEVILKPFGSNRPVAPRKMVVMAGAFLLGLFFPFAYNYLRVVTNTRMRSRKDLEGISIPVIGEIPSWSFSYSKKGLFGRKDSGISTEPIVVAPGNRNIINDAFRVLRTNLKFMSEQRDPERRYKKRGLITMVTSLNAGSGKSFITANMAVSFALREQKVIIVDGDLRHASASNLVEKTTHGITNYLSGRTDNWRSLVKTEENLYGVDVIPVGVFPPNPTELLESNRMKQLMEELAESYDYVFIDCPPVMAMADAQLIERVSNNCIFVVRVGMLRLDSIKLLESFYADKVYRNMSLIVNGVESTSHSYGYGYKDGYHYGNADR